MPTTSPETADEVYMTLDLPTCVYDNCQILHRIFGKLYGIIDHCYILYDVYKFYYLISTKRSEVRTK